MSTMPVSLLADLENWGHFWDAYIKNLWIGYDWWNKTLVFQRMNIYSWSKPSLSVSVFPQLLAAEVYLYHKAAELQTFS